MKQRSPQALKLPFHLLWKNRAVGSIDASGRGGYILDAEHRERRRTRVADGTLAGGRDANDRAFPDGDGKHKLPSYDSLTAGH